MNKSASVSRAKKLGATKSAKAATATKSSDFQIGERVFLLGLKRWGTVKFVGDTLFSDGIWIGAELSDMIGRNDGSVQGHRYFTCKPNHGVFIRPKSCVKGDKSASGGGGGDSVAQEPETDELENEVNLDDSGDFCHTPPVRKLSKRIEESTEKPKLRSRASVGKKSGQIGASSVISKTHDDKIMKRLTSALTGGPRPAPSPRHDSPEHHRSGTPVQQSFASSGPSVDEVAAKVMEMVLNSSVLSNLISNKCDDATKELKADIATTKSAPPTAVEADSTVTPAGIATVSSNVEKRIEHVENSMGDIYCRISDILEAMNKLAATVANGALSSNGTSENSGDANEAAMNEIAQLKGALSMVSNLAKEAHEATLKERQAFNDRIAELESKVST